jgi:transcriptional regulator with XRE-family HTH domain
MPRIRRADLATEAERRNREQLARSGGEVRSSREARRLTQQRVADRAGLGRMVVSRIERGLGGGVTMDGWQRVALAVGRPLIVGLQRDTAGETSDTGHLAIQELVLRHARVAGFDASFELPTRPAEPWRSADVGLRDDRRRLLVIAECWNTIGDVGAATRSSERKRAEAEELAAGLWGEPPHRVAVVWIIRASARNRALVGRYPEVFGSRFPGSSAAWIATLTAGATPPREPGLVWCDLAATRLFAWRRPRGGGSRAA